MSNRQDFPRRPYLVIWIFTAALQLFYWFFLGSPVLFPKGSDPNLLQQGLYWAPFVIAPLLSFLLSRGGSLPLTLGVMAQGVALTWFGWVFLASGGFFLMLFLPLLLAGGVAMWLGCTPRTRAAFAA